MAAQVNDGIVAMVERAVGDGPLYAREPGDWRGEGSSGPEIGTVEGQAEPIGIQTMMNAKIIGPTPSFEV